VFLYMKLVSLFFLFLYVCKYTTLCNSFMVYSCWAVIAYLGGLLLDFSIPLNCFLVWNFRKKQFEIYTTDKKMEKLVFLNF